MAAGTQSYSEEISDPEHPSTPEISVCESCPGKSVFIEDGNTDGWISSDMTVDVTR
ncbi:hypothetical protein [Halogeometricum borinquense]|uniref:hypothetical protein n=1 Tax=Halogeometricum borinquense TaxID=60847 RepID=UPI0013EABCC2|nr:hypothetical protein [Halogeometricum borinquense]